MSIYRFIVPLFLYFLTPLLLQSCEERRKDIEPELIRAEYFMNEYPDSAFALLESIDSKGLNKSQWSKHTQLRVQAKDKLALDVSGDTLLVKALNHFLKQKDNKRTALSYFYLNRIYNQQGNFEKSIQYALLARDYALISKNPDLLGLIHHDIGNLYQKQNNISAALQNYKEAGVYFHQSGNEKYAVYILKFIGNAFLCSSPPLPDSALFYLEKVWPYVQENPDTIQLTGILHSMSVAYFALEKYGHAKDLALQAISYSPELADGLLFNISDIYCELHRPDSALFYLNHVSPEGSNSFDYHYILGKIYTQQTEYDKASKAFEQSEICIISLYKKNMDQSFLEIQKKYDQEKIEVSLQQMKLDHRLLTIIILLCFFLSAILLWISRVQARKKKNKIELIEQHIETIQEMYAEYDKNSLSIKQILLEQLDIVKKVTQLNMNPTRKGTELLELYSNIFNKDLNELLDWKNVLYPAVEILYPGFIGKLKERNPFLSEKEKQFCCLLLSDFQTEEIAFLLSFENKQSVYSQKNRLRKKLEFKDIKTFHDWIKLFPEKK